MIGQLWVSLADYYIRAGHFESARDVYEEAMATVTTVRDFGQVFDAYAQFEESMINARMEASGEEEFTEDGVCVCVCVCLCLCVLCLCVCLFAYLCVCPVHSCIHLMFKLPLFFMKNCSSVNIYVSLLGSFFMFCSQMTLILR